jgi:cell division protein FtsB
VSELDVLRARQEALETANDTLHEAFRSVDGDAHTALEVARQNIKLITALRATQLEHGRAIAGLVTDVTELKTDVTELKTDVAELKTNMGVLTEGMAEVLRRLPEK